MMATRLDIQALRGVAVLLVVAYHFKIPPFRGGYLGVDVFFVISGFLITGMILRDIRSGDFSFRSFYLRRAMRLLPAAYAVIGVTMLVAPFVMTGAVLGDFVKQIWWAIPFAANIGLWLQTGYFEQSAALKPLLHFWSLAIEEQYYLLLPACLLLLPRKLWLPALSVVTLGSVTLCLVAVQVKPGASFYLLPTRLWELGMGSILAATIGATRGDAGLADEYPRWSIAASATAVATLAFVAVAPSGRVHPSIDAIAACVATLMLIATAPRFLRAGPAAGSLAWVGDRSYSLYLVHWPIVSLFRNVYIGIEDPGPLVSIAGLVLALLLAEILYRGVEHRFRLRGAAQASPRALVVLAGAAAGILLGTLVLHMFAAKHESTANRLRANVGLHADCEQSATYRRLSQCQNGTVPRVVLWGDSFAMHWAQGLKDEGIQFVQATRSTCAPVLGLALFGGSFTESWGRSCMAFNADVVNDLVASGVNTVLIASAWVYLLDAEHSVGSSSDSALRRLSRDELAASIAQTVRKLSASGVSVVMILPPPSARFDIGRCHERLAASVLSIGSTRDCQLTHADYAAGNGNRLQWLRELAGREGIALIDPATALCDEKTCRTSVGSTLIYRDSGHLSYEGSTWLAHALRLRAVLAKPSGEARPAPEPRK